MAPSKSNHDLAVSDAAQQVQIDELFSGFGSFRSTIWKAVGALTGVFGVVMGLIMWLGGMWLAAQDRRFERIEGTIQGMASDFSDIKADAAVIKSQITPIDDFRERLRVLELNNAELRSEIKRLQGDKMN